MKNKVDIGELKELLKAQPDLTPTLAIGTRLILASRVNLGDYASMMILGTEETSPEIIVPKEELRRFAEEILRVIK